VFSPVDRRVSAMIPASMQVGAATVILLACVCNGPTVIGNTIGNNELPSLIESVAWS